ncbi:glycosyltransferase [Nocardioides sp. MAHUQ-72]|uniref:glycosyltransferase n=1 Tax=unclassified Nocardioides TaxID=2615069 RepID=UPI0036226D32
MGERVRICLVAASSFPVREPFAGGLEAMTHALARGLVARGHEVSLFAGAGSDPALPVAVLPCPVFEPSEQSLSDVNAPPRRWIEEHHAYLGLMLELARSAGDRFDVVHNNSLHHLPVAMASTLPVPVVTSLHTPPLPWLESAVALSPGVSRFAAVSRATARAWSHVVASTPILNGIPVDAWSLGRGDGPAVWSGRIVPEKAPHEAMDACRLAGLPLVLAGPVGDPLYYEREVVPRLGRSAVHVGHLDHRALDRLLGQATVALVTPAWDEPYGLVAAEAMACGTPVAGYRRGALPEVVPDEVGVLVDPGDVDALAAAVGDAAGRSRTTTRRHALEHCCLDRMLDDYEKLYVSTVSGADAA